jgi:hypothetical protein
MNTFGIDSNIDNPPSFLVWSKDLDLTLYGMPPTGLPSRVESGLYRFLGNPDILVWLRDELCDRIDKRLGDYGRGTPYDLLGIDLLLPDSIIAKTCELYQTDLQKISEWITCQVSAGLNSLSSESNDCSITRKSSTPGFCVRCVRESKTEFTGDEYYLEKISPWNKLDGFLNLRSFYFKKQQRPELTIAFPNPRQKKASISLLSITPASNFQEITYLPVVIGNKKSIGESIFKSPVIKNLPFLEKKHAEIVVVSYPTFQKGDLEQTEFETDIKPEFSMESSSKPRLLLEQIFICPEEDTQVWVLDGSGCWNLLTQNAWKPIGSGSKVLLGKIARTQNGEFILPGSALLEIKLTGNRHE